MYVEKGLREAVAYQFGRDKANNPVAQVSYRNRPIAILSIPPYEKNVEAAQKFIYAVVRGYIRMMEPEKN